MAIFTQDMTLQEMHTVILESLLNPAVHLISDIPLAEADFDKIVPQLRLVLKASFSNYSQKYAESLIVTLVYIAQNHYQDGDFWGPVTNQFMSFNNTERQQIRSIFKFVCDIHGLPNFHEQAQEGHTIITPLICHAGIPDNQLEIFFGLFETAMHNAAQSNWLDLTEELLDYFAISAPAYIKRYLGYLGEQQILFFMQWQDVSQDLYQEDTDAQSLANDLAALYESDEKVIIPQRFLERYCQWRADPTRTSDGAGTRRLPILAPRVRLHPTGLGVYLHLPQQRILQEYPPETLTWRILAGTELSDISCPTYFDRQERVAVTEETAFSMKPGCQYQVKLYSPDDWQTALGSWNFDLHENSYTAFKMNGDWIRSGILTGNQAIILIQNGSLLESDCQIAELAPLPYWAKYKVYTVSFQPGNKLRLINKDSGTSSSILVSDKTQPKLAGGEQFFDNTAIFTKLPRLELPGQPGTRWEVALVKGLARKTLATDLEPGRELELSQFIAEGSYGLVDLRVKNNKGERHQLRCHYVPRVKITNDAGRWPDPALGYLSERIQLVMPAHVQISLTHHQLEGNLVYGQERRMVFSNKKPFPSTHGHLALGDSANQQAIPFKLAMRPLLWTVAGLLGDNQLELGGKTVRQTKKGLAAASEPFLLLTTGDLGAACLSGRLLAQVSGGKIILERPLELKSWSHINFSLMDLLLAPEMADSASLVLKLSLASPDQSIIQEITLLFVQDEIEIFDLKAAKDERSVCFSWQEKGDLIDRVLICKNLCEPWQEDKQFPIVDGETCIYLPQNALSKSIYVCSVQSRPDVSPFDSLRYKPADLFGKDRLIIILGTKKPEVCPLRSFNGAALKYILRKKAADPPAGPARQSQEIDILQLAKSYLLIKQLADSRNRQQAEKTNRMLAKYRQLARRAKTAHTLVIRTLLQENFSREQLQDLLCFFELNWLKNDQASQQWQRDDFMRLADVMPELALQISLSRSSFLDWLVRWPGEPELRQLCEAGPEQSVQDLLQNRLEKKVPPERLWGRHKDYWGSYTDNLAFISYVTNLKKSEQSQSNEELLYKFDLENNSGRRRLFGKSYLLLIQGLNTAIGTKVAAERAAETIVSFVHRQDKEELKILKYAFPDMMKQLEARLDDNFSCLNELAYSLGYLVLLGTLYRYGMRTKNENVLVRHLGLARQHFPDFFRHDLVLMELYLLDGGISDEYESNQHH